MQSNLGQDSFYLDTLQCVMHTFTTFHVAFELQSCKVGSRERKPISEANIFMHSSAAFEWHKEQRILWAGWKCIHTCLVLNLNMKSQSWRQTVKHNHRVDRLYYLAPVPKLHSHMSAVCLRLLWEELQRMHPLCRVTVSRGSLKELRRSWEGGGLIISKIGVECRKKWAEEKVIVVWHYLVRWHSDRV